MNTYFQKLNFSIDPGILNFADFKGDFYFGYECNGSRLDYYYIRNDLKLLVRQLFSKIADVSPSQFKFVEITGATGTVDPHRDYDLLCSVNYYFKAGGATTFWYKAKEHAVEQISTEYLYQAYNHNDIELSDKFTAKNNECYLLNNAEIHSVSAGNETRQFIQIQYDKPYYEIARLLGVAGEMGFEPMMTISKTVALDH